MRVLIVEDEKPLALLLQQSLAAQYVIDLAYTGQHGLFLAFTHEYDVIVLDLSLPDISAYEVCQELRQNGICSPLLITGTNQDIGNKVLLLNAGADDYLLKPFDQAELKARIAVLLRRRSRAPTSTLCVAEFQLNPLTRSVLFRGKPLRLTRKEFLILEYLLRRPDEIINRFELLEHVWEEDPQALLSNTIDVHINSLRKKIGKPDSFEQIKTVHGSGYMLDTKTSSLP
jgi:two-component system, OmpR family, response regulator